ncbi:MAG: hypothetical protein BKPUNTRY_002161, partial [Candidatus Fervidibacter sp.]
LIIKHLHQHSIRQSNGNYFRGAERAMSIASLLLGYYFNIVVA